jgi:hypothetical protein
MSNVSGLRVARYERLSAFSLAALMVLGVAPLAHGALTLAADDDSVTNTVASVSAAATGATMATGLGAGGPLVTVTFSDGSMSSGVWGTIGGGSADDGGAFGAGFSLTQDGETYPPLNFGSAAWTLTNSHATLSIISAIINAEVGAVTFDNIGGLAVVSAGSSLGSPFTQTTNAGLMGTATYSHQIDVLPAGGTDGVDIGDLYGVLTLVFSGGGLAVGTSVAFEADTDLLPAAIPEASQILAFSAVGLVCGGAAYLRKRRAAKPA